MGETRRSIAAAALGVVLFAAFVAYMALRTRHEKDFPFLWGSLFVNGILLLLAGAIITAAIVVAVRGGWVTRLVAAIAVGGPSLLLAVADYAVSEADLDVIPGRLRTDPGHTLGMIGLGVAVGLLVFAVWDRDGTRPDGSPATHADTTTADADALP